MGHLDTNLSHAPLLRAIYVWKLAVSHTREKNLECSVARLQRIVRDPQLYLVQQEENHKIEVAAAREGAETLIHQNLLQMKELCAEQEKVCTPHP
jgi:hypothetical protein